MPRPMAIAVANRAALMPTTPASRTKILKGAGGGSSDGTSTAIIPCRRSDASACAIFSPVNRFRASASPPFFPRECSTRQPATDPATAIATYHSIRPGWRVTITISSTSVMPGSGRNEESRKATRKRPGAPSVSASPVQLDLFYRTGASAVAISTACYAVTVAAIVWIVRSLTDSTAAACAGAVVFALNPNMLYLQSTPMTEPMLLATATTAVAMLIEWSQKRHSGPHDKKGYGSFSTDVPEKGPYPFVGGRAFALSCLTRYAAGPVTGTAPAARAGVRWPPGPRLPAPARDVS